VSPIEMVTHVDFKGLVLIMHVTMIVRHTNG